MHGWYLDPRVGLPRYIVQLLPRPTHQLRGKGLQAFGYDLERVCKLTCVTHESEPRGRRQVGGSSPARKNSD
jgi:hypothetical protein